MERTEEEMGKFIEELESRQKSLTQEKQRAIDDFNRGQDEIRSAYRAKKWIKARNELSDVSGGTTEAWYGLRNYPHDLVLFSCFGSDPEKRSDNIRLSTADAIALRNYLISLDLGEDNRNTESTSDS